LPTWQEACLRIYDAADYAENLFNVPAVAYAGEKDEQRQAALNIKARLENADFPYSLRILTAPGLAHTFPAEWQRKARDAYLPHIVNGKPDNPKRVRFVTWTLRYPTCRWVEVLGLDRHYDKALVDATRTEAGFKVKTANVQALHLTLSPDAAAAEVEVAIDGQTVKGTPWLAQDGTQHAYLERRGKDWTLVLPQRLATRRAREPRKTTGQQGPIDDAFMDGFLCVRGTGTAWHEATGAQASATLERFREEWSKWWRGDLPVKDDRAVTGEDIATKHLILFGDPSSNSLIAQVLDGLPLRWDREAITLAGKAYPSASHLPVMIYPSPLNPGRYVVLNSGHTFGGKDYRGTNALLFPRLGDYAVLNVGGGPDAAPAVATAGLFDEHWRLGTK
jgi:hypothetical protein